MKARLSFENGIWYEGEIRELKNLFGMRANDRGVVRIDINLDVENSYYPPQPFDDLSEAQ